MERQVGGYDIQAARRVQYDYERLLDMASAIHSERYCIKHVPAAARIQTRAGDIFMFASNGRPFSTPEHNKQYHPENLKALISAIPADAPERIPLLQGVSAAHPDRPISCPELRDLSGADTCIKGFSYTAPGRATRKTEDFCPNSRAGCSERILLEWSRYAIALQAMTGASTLVIPTMEFAPDDPNPRVTYATDFTGPTEQLVVPDPGVIIEPDSEIHLMSQILPCHTCTRVIVDSGVSQVYVRELSKYVENGAVYIDGDDVWSMDHLFMNGVEVICSSPNFPVFRA